MNYELKSIETEQSIKKTMANMAPFLRAEKKSISLAVVSMLVNSAATFIGPFIIGHAIDKYVITKNYTGVLISAGVLVVIYGIAFVSNYWQMMNMGMVGQRTLYAIRNMVFKKLSELPLAFFNANRAGDLISRLNSDTEKLNQFFSEVVVRFVGIIVTIIGVAAFLIGINPRLGLIALSPVLLIAGFTWIASPWIKKKSKASLRAIGDMSSEIQESLENFKVVVSFNRRDFMREKFGAANDDVYAKTVSAAVASALPDPVYGLAGSLAQLLVLIFGIAMISTGHFSLGLLVSFLVYVNQFYSPLRQISMLWTQLQNALAAWDRIASILSLETDLKLSIDNAHSKNHASLVSFDGVSFGYMPEQKVLRSISFTLEAGKTYAFVGPTGGGKTTTASLLARMYDPTEGDIYLSGKKLSSYTDAERAEKIGYILQDPFLFSGTVQDNIFYGNTNYENLSRDEALEVLKNAGLDSLLARFDQGLETKVQPTGDMVSLGQKQIIAFMRAVLRKPEILILDEATANIDTVTEQVLGEILEKLPQETTRIVIAHRLNTIKNADEIFFVNGHHITNAGSFEHAVELLLNKAGK
jgi:ATP-binding cassette subfamily B protein